jgi:C1A family cysteine protease
MTITHRYGWHPSKPDQRDHVFSASLETITSLPSSVDLRPMMPPVYDQLTIGACTAHAIAAAVEYETVKQGLKPITRPSRLFIYYNERLMEGTVDSDAGAQIRDGIKVVSKYGVCQEPEWPYIPDQFAVKPTDKCYTDALKEIVTSYSSVPQSLTQMQSVLAQRTPIVIGFSVYESFESQEVATTGIVPMPAQNEACLGGHAVLVCGYQNSTRRFIVRNSWGPDWGIKGYFEMPYEYLLSPQLASDFWAIKLVKE